MHGAHREHFCSVPDMFGRGVSAFLRATLAWLFCRPFGTSAGGADPGVPSPTARNQIRLLARYLQMSAAREGRLLAEFSQYYPRAVRRCARGLCSRDAWALELAPAGTAELRCIFCMVVGFFLSETECERLFSVELRRKPSRMKVAAREDILKIKTDGLPLSLLTAGGRPVGDFWFRAQEKYAKLHGTRVMKNRLRHTRAEKRR